MGDRTAGIVSAVLLVACFATAAPAGAAEHNVTVRPKPIYTPTGITVHQGDTITVTASGRIHFGGGPINSLPPTGVPWGPICRAIAHQRLPWPASGIACWSLIARIGNKQPIVGIGKDKTFRADHDGELQLGVNDNFVRDNSGSWAAKVTVTPVGGAPASKSSSNGALVLFAIFGGVLAAALLVFLLLRRRRTREEPGETKSEPAPDLAPVAAAGAAGVAVAPPAPEPAPVPVVPAMPNAPPDPESIDVNIFEVELTNGLQLRVGYNHFPDGTPVNWRITQSRKPVAVGSFVTKGGGSTNHYETMPLGVKLAGRDSEPDGADVQFDWSINGVPFRYSVRRDSNC